MSSKPPLNPPSFRFPFKLPDDTPDEIRKSLEFVYNGLTVHEQAFRKLMQGTTETTVVEQSGGGGGSSTTGVTSFNTHMGNVTYFPYLGTVNDQLGNPAYLTEPTDNGAKIIVGDSVPGIITLNPSVSIPWFTIIDNDSSAPFILNPGSGTLHGPNVINDSSFGIVFFDGTDWWAGVAGAGGGGGGPAGPPGPPGPTGPTGAAGAQGQFLYIESDAPEEPMLIPGPVGAPGATGAAGPMGTPGVTIPVEPDSPDEPLMIPGPPGATGATGATGPAGSGVPIYLEPDSPDEPMMIPGPPSTGGGGGGTVTSVGLSMPSDFIVANSPVTTSGTLAVTRGGVYTGNTAYFSSVSTPSSPVTAAFGSAITKGNAILLYVGWYGGSLTPTTITDTLGNTYTLVVSDGQQQSLYVALNSPGGANTVTVNFTGSFVTLVVRGFEYQNIVSVSAVDGSAATHTDTGGGVYVANLTSSNPSDVLVGHGIMGGTPVTSTFTSGYTQRFTNHDSLQNSTEFLVDKNVTSASAQSLTWTEATVATHSLLLVALKVSTGVQDFNGRVGHIIGVGTDIPVFGPSGAGHAQGAVPDPGSTAGSSKFLREDGTWVTPPGSSGSGGGTGAEITSASTQSIPNVTDTTAVMATVVADVGGFTGVTSNALVIPSGLAGWYSITTAARWSNSSNSGERDLWIKKNGSFTTGPIGTSMIAGASAEIGNQACYVTQLAVGDVITLDLFQNSGGSLNVLNVTLSMAYLGANSGPIAKVVVVGNSTTSVTFSAIPGTYTNLRVSFVGQTSNAAAESLFMTFNGDTAAHYDYAIVFNSSPSAASGFSSNAQTAINFGALVGPSSSSWPGQVIVTVGNYAGTSFYKSVTGQSSQATSSSCNASSSGGFWRSTAAITSITFTLGGTDHFIAGSVFTLYGES